jgi:hypothetical protein
VRREPLGCLDLHRFPRVQSSSTGVHTQCPPCITSCALLHCTHMHPQPSTAPLQGKRLLLRLRGGFGATLYLASSVVYHVSHPAHDGAGAGVTQHTGTYVR